MKTKNLRQLFQNNFNCYADTEDESVVLAMDEDQFVKVVFPLLQAQPQRNDCRCTISDWNKEGICGNCGGLHSDFLTPKEL